MNKAALYIRVSTERQVEEGFSLDAQHDILMDVANRKALQLYRVYSDPGISGGSFTKRPGIQAMLTDMKAKRFDTILVHKLDRLSRNQGDLYEFIGLINKLDVRLIIASQGTEEIDTRSPMGKAFLSFSGIWAELYLDNLREETLKGLTKKIQLGGKHISRPPLGYEFDDDKNLIIVESEAVRVRKVFELYLKGWGVVKISKHMNEFSTGKEGGKWDSKSVRNIITNPTYAGYNHFKPAHWSEDKRIMTDGKHEPIISREDYEKAQSYIERRSNGQMSKRSFDYAFSGIVKCAECGGNYVGNSTVQNGRTYKSYRCLNNYVRHTCSAPTISERMLNELVLREILKKDLKVAAKQEEKKEKGIDIGKEVEKSNMRRKNWMLALGDGKLTPDDYAMLIDEEDVRMKEIYAALDETAAAYEPEIPVEELKKLFSELSDNWQFIEPATQKQMIQNMIRKTTIKKEKNGWTIPPGGLLTV